MIKIELDFKDEGKFKNLIRYIENNLIYPEAQEQIRVLGHHVADHMRETIKTEKKNPPRPYHKLENAITAETLRTTGGVEVGIGNIEKLKQEAPHFEMIDVGGQYVTKETHLVPTTYFKDKGSGFVTFKAGSSHIIEGIHYVSKAVNYIDRELKMMVKKLGGIFVEGLKKASK